jgi:2,3-bisphosphoglycerate-independent phosphoglycerate mutase
MLTVIDEEISPESDSGAMALLGYDPLRFYTGRGALEALGLGFLEVGDNGVGFRVNFASYDEERGRLDRRTSRDLSDPELQQLVAEVNAGIRLDGFGDVIFSFTGFARHRGILCFKSAALPLSANVSNTDPGFRKVGVFGIANREFEPKPLDCVAEDDTPGAANTARLVNQFVRESSAILRRSAVNARRKAAGKLPANILLFRDAGQQAPDLETFPRRMGRSISFYGQIPAEHGLCRLIGGRWTESHVREGQAEEDYYRELAPVLLADDADLVFAHIKGPDEPGHDNQPDEKVRAIERIDDGLIRRIAAGLGPDDVLVVTSDHATPCELGIHAADRVPVVIHSRRVPADATERFCEREAAARGALPLGRAVELMPYLRKVLAEV